MKLSVVIVSYNVRTYLLQCLDAVGRATVGLDAEVWVVDNASADGSVEAVREAFPDVHIIANTENVGFARANNAALRRARGEYALLLNPDTIVGEDVLRRATEFLDSHPQAGAVGARMLNRDGTFAPESRRGLPTPATAFYKMSGLARLFPSNRRFGRYHMRYLDEHEAAEIEIISGAFFFARTAALAKAGFLDEDYFMYGEDVDLSYRLMLDGWQNWYLPATILHYKGESTVKTSYRYVHNFYDAMLIFFRKHFARRYRLTTLIVWPAVMAIATAEMAVRKTARFLADTRDVLLRLAHRDTQAACQTMAYVGSDEGWEALQPLAGRSGFYITREAGEATTLIAFERETVSYADMLRRIGEDAAAGRPRQIATFSTQTRTLILSDDVIQG